MPQELRAECVEVGALPPLGEVPVQMHAWTIRPERYGEPEQAFEVERVDVPSPGPGEVLVAVMAAGVNYNAVWAGRGRPLDVIAQRRKSAERDQEPFQICGTDASGIVYALGPGVEGVRVGDEVLIHGCQWDLDCPHVAAGGDPVLSRTFRVWGYETNWGSFAQFCKVQARQCVRKPPHLSWEEAASYAATGGATYRMLFHWQGNVVKPGDTVLIWGGAGGLGSLGIQLVREAGAKAVAVVSSADKFDFCMELGASGCINRRDFDHWGALPDPADAEGQDAWLHGREKGGVLAFRRALWKAAGARVSPQIVLEHPGADTLPTSLFLCAPGGMVVTCGATSGYVGTIDLRYLWMQQKRLQGSHGGDDHDLGVVNQMMIDKKLRPCLSRTFRWDELRAAHALMARNEHPSGNIAVLVGAARTGMGRA
jgi:crotonyl-CoA carboxylase/reductase